MESEYASITDEFIGESKISTREGGQAGTIGTRYREWMQLNPCAVGEWVWLPEEPQAGASLPVALVSRLRLAKVQHVHANGTIVNRLAAL